MRRTAAIFGAITATVMSAAGLAGCGTSNALSTNQSTANGNAGNNVTLTLYTGGDVNVQTLWEQDLIPLYEKAHPNVKINVVFDAHGTDSGVVQDKIVAAEKANKNSGYDIIDSGIVPTLAKADMLQKLSPTQVPNISHVDPALLQQTQYEGLPYRGSSVVLAYNSANVKNPPQTLDSLLAWIKANPGKFTYNTPSTGGSGGNFVMAVVNSKVPAQDQAKLVTSSSKSLEGTWTPGLNLLKSLGPDIYRNGFYPNGNTGTLNLLANGSIWLAPVWSDMALSALQDKQLPSTIKLLQLTPPFAGGPADMGVVKNSPNTKAADAFLNWLLTPQAQTIIIDKMNGYPGVEWKYVPQTVQQKYAAIAKSYATGWSSFYGADLNQAWQNTVAAH